MNSKNDYHSLRNVLIDRISVNHSLPHNNEKYYKLILFILLLTLFATIINGFIRNFTLSDLIYIIVLTVLIGLFVASKVDTQMNVQLNPVFTCPHCLKNILVKNIDKIKCPYCDAENLTFENVIFGCSHCDDQIRLLNCPHCQVAIDLDLPYDIIELKEKRYD